MNTLKIGERIIGKGCPCFTIAEAGINHNGELEKAYKMIEVARKAEADAVKFQTFKAEEFIADPNITYTYKSQGEEVTESMLEMFRRYEFKDDDWFKIKGKCDKEGIMFLSTPQNLSDLDLLLKVGIPAIKVGSDDFTNLPLLRSYSKTGLPMLMSCGMSDLKEVRQVLEATGVLKGYPAVLMVCTSEYPTPPKDANLLRLKTLADIFPDIILGYSDHTEGSLASSLAVSLGAKVLEKHFTLDHDFSGPDHWFSEDPESLKEWVFGIRLAFIMMGSGKVEPTAKEALNKKGFRRAIVASRPIKEGEVFSFENLTMKRISGCKGLPPADICGLINKKSKKDYRKDEPIKS